RRSTQKINSRKNEHMKLLFENADDTKTLLNFIRNREDNDITLQFAITYGATKKENLRKYYIENPKQYQEDMSNFQINGDDKSLEVLKGLELELDEQGNPVPPAPTEEVVEEDEET